MQSPPRPPVHGEASSKARKAQRHPALFPGAAWVWVALWHTEEVQCQVGAAGQEKGGLALDPGIYNQLPCCSIIDQKYNRFYVAII